MKNRLIEPPVCRPNFKILLLKFWKVCSECPYSKIEKHITNLNDGYLAIQRNAHYESGKDIPSYTCNFLYLDLLIFNNFSSMTFFCATRILRVIGR